MGSNPTPHTYNKPPAPVAVVAEHGFWLMKEGYRESTVERRLRLLKTLVAYADLMDPEAVKAAISQMRWSEGTKEFACCTYALFARCRGLRFDKPRYRRIEKLPFIPFESETDALICGLGPKTSAVLQPLKETGARIGEVWSLRWADVDLEHRIVTFVPEKGSRLRQFRINPRLCTMIDAPPRGNVRIFGSRNLEKSRRNYEKQRRRLAEKLGNPRLNQITFHTFRHWKATYEYHRTHDILHVMRLLGHKSIQNTLRYTQLVDWKSDDFICKTAKTVEEEQPLIEVGFEYVTEIDGLKLFRKRK